MTTSEKANVPANDLELERRGLPPLSYYDNSAHHYGDAPVIGVKRGFCGYWPIYTPCTADELNESNGVTKAQAEAMLYGSMFGWDVPASYPKTFLNLEDDECSYTE